MRISPVANFNIGNSSIYISRKYNTSPVSRINQVQGNNYSYRRSIQNKIINDSYPKMMNTTFSVNPRSKTIVLNDGKLFVGTLIDIRV